MFVQLYEVSSTHMRWNLLFVQGTTKLRRHEIRVESRTIVSLSQYFWPPPLEDRIAGQLNRDAEGSADMALRLAKQTAEESTTLRFSELFQLTGV